MGYRYIHSYKRKRLMNAYLFSLALLSMLLLCLGTAFLNAGPIVLGTELNTNGLVEYLCLGRGCENLTATDW